MNSSSLLVCCPVCGAVLPGFGADSFPLSDGVRVWSCSSCGASGYAPWPASCNGVVVVSSLGSFAPGGCHCELERPMGECLVPMFRHSDCVDELVLHGRSGLVWSVCASSGVPVGLCMRDGLRVDVWHVLRPGRVSSCYLDGDLGDVDYLRAWVDGGAGGVVPAGSFVGC